MSFVCEICNENAGFTWTDFHGEVICLRCGTPYQYLQYDENKKRIKDAVPKINIRDDYRPWIKKYWDETHRNMGLGRYMGERPYLDDHNALMEWIEKNYPE